MFKNVQIDFPYVAKQLFFTSIYPPSESFPPPKLADCLSDYLNSWEWIHHGLLPGLAPKKWITLEK